MCTHFDLHSKDVGQLLKDGNNISTESWINEGGFTPLYNVRRSSAVPIIRRRDPASVPNLSSMQWDAYRDSPLVLETMTWGIERTTVNDTVKMNITAKAETVLAKNVQYWDSLKGVGRCVVPCNGYYIIPKGAKKPVLYVKRRDGHLLLLAGLHDASKSQFAIITTQSSSGLPLEGLAHGRPVVFEAEFEVNQWLTASSWLTINAKSIITKALDLVRLPLDQHQVSPAIRLDPNTESSDLIVEYRPTTPPPKPARKSRAKGKTAAEPPRTPSPSHSPVAGPSTLTPNRNAGAGTSGTSTAKKRKASELEAGETINNEETTPSKTSKTKGGKKGSTALAKAAKGSRSLTSYFPGLKKP
ncbi:hypothetical protein D9611_000888 [Ephemerocybe angulata]|uniref:Uncharacterized protein n=1 Tax=Ephemerocybe angulata TaxID=980116 RepID=A0A8H5BNT3_9AGAR|nr:hypothetical protein D9611_000888 [Tulosesus angulatus]